MTKESGNKKKRRLLKAIVLCMIIVAAFGILVLVYNANSSSHTQFYEESDKNLNTVIAKELRKAPDKLTVDDYLKVEITVVYENELTDLRPLAKLKNLNMIVFDVTPQDIDLRPLAKLKNLNKIIFYVTPQDIDFRPLAKLKKLKTLDIQMYGIPDTSFSLSEPRFFPIKGKRHWYHKVFSFFRRFKSAQPETMPFDITMYLDLRQFRKIRNLESLKISGFELRNIKAIASLKNLETLEIVPSFKRIKLDLNRDANTKQRKPKPPDLSPLINLPKLINLDIPFLRVKDYNFIGKLKNLNYLRLQSTNITDINLLANLTSLKSLDLSYTKIENIDILASLVNLRTLKLSETQVRDIGVLSKLTHLEYLDISGTKIITIEPLAKLKNLTSLSLRNTTFSEDEIDELRKALPNLKIQR